MQFGSPGIFDLGGSTSTISLDSAIMHTGLDFPFINASNATLEGDEHSLVILPPGIDLLSVFGNVRHDGLTHVVGSDLTIPAGREIRGTGDLGDSISRVHVHGKLID